MQRTAKIPPIEKEGLFRFSESLPTHPIRLADDARWRLARSIVAGPHFNKSPLLSRFLLFIVAETLQGRQDEITERQIGVQVFGRPGDYRTAEDNIVRNYARQLRKRLADHFSSDGLDDSMQIVIPLGGYVPEFVSVDSSQPADAPSWDSQTPLVQTSQALHAPATGKTPPPAQRKVILAASLFLYSLLLVALTWFVRFRFPLPASAREPESALWRQIFDPSRNTYIVPPDAGLNLIEDLSQRLVPLPEYIRSSYREVPLPRMDLHSEADLRSQQFTGFTNLQIVTAIMQRPEYRPARVFLRFPRDLRLDDLKSANAILLGSACSNPWAALAEEGRNFQIQCSGDMQDSAILNRRPLAGEMPSYASHWNEPVHETYALILFVPNLDGNGNLLLLEGLDVAGTQAAADALVQSPAVQHILDRAKHPNGSLGTFEILLRAKSVQSHAIGTEVIASRIQ